jgi:hypothetical protein
MPNPAMTDEQMQQTLDLVAQYGRVKEAAEAIGVTYNTLSSRYQKARRWAARRDSLDPYIHDGLKGYGVSDMAGVKDGWLIKKDGEGGRLSLRFKVKDEEVDIIDTFKEALSEMQPLDQKLYAPRISRNAKAERLLVLDLADVHFGKLCEVAETGSEYSIEAARHRVIEGTRGLLDEAGDVGRILFVMGNDILHTDNGKTSTSGTPQDTDKSFFAACKAAEQASIDAIGMCAAVAEVDLIHCMSNHDWRSGWMLSQTIAAGVRGWDGVRATEYNLSQRHRKYYGFGRNLMGFTHGDGAKEESLYAAMTTEARDLMLKGCDLYYWYLHHVHHKIRKRRGVDVFQSEKDHTGNMTVVSMGAARPEEGQSQIEYVRSPSPPDGWHDRNCYLNRQGVEAFIHSPHDGQKKRFTEWF